MALKIIQDLLIVDVNLTRKTTQTKNIKTLTLHSLIQIQIRYRRKAFIASNGPLTLIQ